MRGHRNLSGSIASIVCLVSLALVSSCSHKAEETSSTETPGAADQTAQTPVTPAVSDAEIVAIVVAANDADIDNGKQAKSKSKNAEVKSFGDMMVADHGATNDKAKSLAAQLGVSPQENATSKAIKSEQDSLRSAIGKMSGSAFDKAYVNNEVAYHEHVLNALDQTLIPNAQNEQLKQLLNDTRPVVSQHLDHARDLQNKMNAMSNR